MFALYIMCQNVQGVPLKPSNYMIRYGYSTRRAETAILVISLDKFDIFEQGVFEIRNINFVHVFIQTLPLLAIFADFDQCGKKDEIFNTGSQLSTSNKAILEIISGINRDFYAKFNAVVFKS